MADVLLVDDDGSVLLTLAIALRRHGHTVTVAGDAQQALQKLELHRFEFLVSDVRMPGMSGVELALHVSRQADAPRVILTSAHAQIPPREGEVVAFFPKPVDPARLSDLLSSPPDAPTASGSDTPPSNEARSNQLAERAKRYTPKSQQNGVWRPYPV